MHADGRAVLNKSGAIYPVLHSNTICFIEPGPGCQYKDFLNVYQDASSPKQSWKDLVFEIGVASSTYWSTTSWGVTNASPWAAHDQFLACSTSVADEYLLYLQTGTDIPFGQNCSLTKLA